jgi:hypothetical protein
MRGGMFSMTRVSMTRKQSNSYGHVAEMSARTRVTDNSNDPAEKERANIM